MRFAVGIEYGRRSIDDVPVLSIPSCRSGLMRGAYGARYGVPKFSRLARYATIIIARIIIPTKPVTALMHRNSSRSIDSVPTWSGTQNIPIADSAIISTDGEDISPDFTAVSPKTIAPTTDSDMPKYLGILSDAWLSISNSTRTTSISMGGGKGIPVVAAIKVIRNFSGSSWK